MTITEALNVALNGIEAGVTDKAEAKALVLQSISDALCNAPLETAEYLSRALGMEFQMNDGRLAAVTLSERG